MEDAPSHTFERILTTEEKSALRGESFSNRELDGLDLSGADLRGARFDRTLLVRCNLAGADLRGARFVLCDLRGVDFADTVFGDNRFDGTTFVDVVGLSESTRALIARGGGTFQPRHASTR
ncbi:MAG: pentapeptide repeat-containing protein [Labilithrix sp.]|nr:pentapeptide repeat-containing protein [Labilithrix sp.]MCW5834966.1 pentapeptide repeat-containing protein [Labilithrix sp.]